MRRTVSIIAAVTLCGACASDQTVTGGSTTTAPPGVTATTASPAQPADPPATSILSEPLPPHSTAELVELLDPFVSDLGFRVTRASLVDLGTYQASPDGRHLAVYVAPLSDTDPDSHAAAFVHLAAAFLPTVFDRWDGLESFDICQEPHAWPGGSTPPAVTVIDLDRQTALDIDWSTIDLSGLVARALIDPYLTVTANPDVAATPTWAAAESG